MKKLGKILLAFLITLSLDVYSGGYKTIIDLSGSWKFTIGDDINWAKSEVDESDWTDIKVPSKWESQGFQGYDGYAWYRTSFKLKKEYINDYLVLQLGYIDDVDEVYVNGKMIGRSGSFPPDYQTTSQSLRRYTIPRHVLNKSGVNTIAVRVYDNLVYGGITGGEICIQKKRNYVPLDIDLSGKWEIRKGYCWHKKLDIEVPGSWESQGIDYNGIASYIKTFRVPKDLTEDILILSLGIIDEKDEVYINDKFIGRTGNIYNNHLGNEWKERRFYFVPKGVLSATKENTIKIVVSDVYGRGGIYEGPIGFVKRGNNRNYRRIRRSSELDYNLEGNWSLIIGDPGNVGNKYQEIFVPGSWENQGFKNYDGVVTYRKKFNLTKSQIHKSYILLLGLIDETDETYLNGQRIGKTGDIYGGQLHKEWLIHRRYKFLSRILKVGENVIQVTVKDVCGRGGIYEGPVGLISEKKYDEYIWNRP